MSQSVSESEEMCVVKRDGRREPVAFEKVSERLKTTGDGLHCNFTSLAQKVLAQIVDGIPTSKLDELAAALSIENVTTHPDYGTLAARIIISNHQRNTQHTFAQGIERLYRCLDKLGRSRPMVSEALYNFTMENAEVIENAIHYDRDYLFDFFGFKTLEKSYLLRDSNKKIVERPQHMWMRVSLGLWTGDLAKGLQTYDMMSRKLFTHATPTLFNAGTPRPQLSSCFLIAMKEDSISGIYETLKECALISQNAGGIGLHIHNIRAEGSTIYGTNGTSNGLVPMLRNFNSTARYVDQGGGKRNGSFAIYLEPWHADINKFIELKLNNGQEEQRCRDLFYALWVPDLFMERVRDNASWTLFCPYEAPGLADVVGDDFKELYGRYEKEGRGRTVVSAQKLWFDILKVQIETGMPYLLYKDAANLKSNQRNLGVIKSSNLCTEIMEYSSPDETAVCNLASIALPSFIKDGAFNFDDLRDTVKIVVRNLNHVIDVNFYPTEPARRSNMRHRPIGLGVQGLADVFALLKIPWEEEVDQKVVPNPDAVILNKRIFAHMYYAAVEMSVELAKQEGTYETWNGSPSSKGLLQPDLWKGTELIHDGLDWDGLRESVKKFGLRNSLLVAPMPTASTSQILGFNECFEPFTTNFYKRLTLAGEFIQVNKYLVRDLLELGIWSPELKNKIISRDGSVQGLAEIPLDIQNLYKTVWEMKQKTLIDMAADRGPYICQSQSLNLFVKDPHFANLTSMHFYAWSKGLKTGIYYLRSLAPVTAQKVTIAPDAPKSEETDKDCLACSA